MVCEQQVVAGPHTAAGALWEGGLLEGLSQTAGVLNGLHLGGGCESSHRGMLVGVRGLRFFRLPTVGDCVRYRIELIKWLSPLTLMSGRASVDDRMAAEGQLKFYTETDL